MDNLQLRHHSAAFVFLLALLFIAYGIARYETMLLLGTYTIMFGIYLWVIVQDNPPVRYWITVAIFFRIALIPAIPNLSDDFYRFIWDGRLWHLGIHPFAHVPSYYVDAGHPEVDAELYARLNSQEYFTIYPSVPQFIFWVSTWIFSKSIIGSTILLRIIILGAELGNIWLIRKLLAAMNFPARRVLWYAVNPLVILELTGNLHHEALVLVFMLGTFYLLHHDRLYLSSIAYALAIASKLIPLVFVPILFFRLGWKKGSLFLLATAGACAILFVPLFTPEFLSGMDQSLGYYFRKFEFNASVYYLWREWGFFYYGHNIIGNIGWRLAVIGAMGIVVYSYWTSRKTFTASAALHSVATSGLMEGFMFVLLIYLLSVTTLHPWYIVPLLAFSLFTIYRYAIVWTYLIFLTYSGYMQAGFQENLYLTAFEYIIVSGFLFFELFRKNPYKHTWPNGY